MDKKTKNALCEFWIKGGDNEVLMDDIVSSDDEREKSNNTNHQNDNSDSFFKPYFDAQERNNISTFEKGQKYFNEHKPKIYGHNIGKLVDISISDDEEIILLNKEASIRRPYWKEEKDFGGILIFWNSSCCSHAGIQDMHQHTILLINATWRIIHSKYQGSSSF
ncbi:hypothetical protein Tco_0174303 [Tanacetum coccineum]